MTPVFRARTVLLKSFGVVQLDKTEAEEARLIRESRERCGCSCTGTPSSTPSATSVNPKINNKM